MPNRVLKKKLMLIHHVATLEEKSLANKIYREQKENKLPGLVTECEVSLRNVNISLEQMKKFTKK